MKDIIYNYLTQNAVVMQVATVDGDQPWICSVYFVADDDLNLYWLSWPMRRHSLEVARHPKVAVAIVVKADQPIIGLQVQGIAEEVQDGRVVEKVMERYIAKYKIGQKFYANFMKKKNKHHLYKIHPELFVVMDEVRFPEKGRVEWRP